MSDICGSFFSFFTRCFASESKKENQVKYKKILSKKTVKSIKSNDSIVSSSNEENEKNNLKIEDSESKTKISLVEEEEEEEKEEEEEIIFPKEYLNSTELAQNFKFKFTKKKLIEFFESEIKDTTQYKQLANKNGFDIYIKESGSIFSSEIPMIKMFYKIRKSEFKIKNVNIKLLDEYMNIPEKRLSWDDSIRHYEIIEKAKSNDNEEVYLLHYICKSPFMFVSERDVVEKRYDFYENDIYYDFSSSVNDDYISKDSSIVRIIDHCSLYKMYEENDYFNFISITQVDTKSNLPSSLINSALPTNYKKWYDSLFNSINGQNIENDKS